MRSFSSGDYSGRNPFWYWTQGLHDAQVLRAETFEIPFNKARKQYYDCSCLKLHLDSSGALLDRFVKSITFYNCKILVDNSHLGGYQKGSIDGCYWMQDILKYENGKYVLDISLLGRDDFLFRIRFDDAEVERTK